jgi:hypothetical protein
MWRIILIFNGALRRHRPNDEAGGRTSKSSPDSSVKRTDPREPCQPIFWRRREVVTDPPGPCAK